MTDGDDNGDNEDVERAVGLLQKLGLKEYEAMCLVGLSRVSEATAKELSEWTGVPRTRVYDATRVLEAQGLVEVQHGSPQRFRAVSIPEAIETLRQQYESRFDALRDTLEGLDSPENRDDDDVHEVWSLTGRQAVENRIRQIVEGATDEVAFVVGSEAGLSETVVDCLNGALDRGVSVSVGVLDADLKSKFEPRFDGARVFVTGLDWLHGPDDETAIGRLLMADGESILISAVDPVDDTERAVYGRGFGNGLVVIFRRLLSTGLPAAGDSGGSTSG